MIRPEALATLARWREVAVSAALAGLGLWLAARGGAILLPLGLGLAGVAAVLGLGAWRRLRFAQDPAAPGVVEVVEGEVRYFGPRLGGAVSLSDLTELRLITLRGRRLWRLKQADGQALLIPVDATGAEALFDGFTSLPGLDMAALLSALDPAGAGGAALPALADQPAMQVIWARKGRGLVA